MNREIKFRVWDNQSDFYWGEGEGMDFKKIAFNFYDALFTDESRLVFEQYTGLKDKNGVEIYEGDIVKATSDQYINENFVGKVIFDEGCFLTWINKNDIRGIWGEDDIEVIGNIFENTERIRKSMSVFEKDKERMGLPKDGQKITFMEPCEHAWHTNVITDQKYLVIGQEYTVRKTQLNSSSTYVWLEEIETYDTERDVPFFNMWSFDWEGKK